MKKWQITNLKDVIPVAEKKVEEETKRLGLTCDQVNMLYAVASARCGYNILNMLVNKDIDYNKLSFEGDMVDQTKRSAIRNILDLFGFELMDKHGDYKHFLYEVHNLLKQKLRLELYKNQLNDYKEGYLVAYREIIEEDEFNAYAEDGRYYTFGVDNGCLDTINIINDKFAIFGSIRLTSDYLKGDKELVDVIRSAGIQVDF